MAQSSTTLHEQQLPADVVDRHRAIVSLMEELEAVDWYDQRAYACTDPELKQILEHNRDEEKEHACMVLEWLRRNDPGWDEYLRKFLFRQGSITHAEGAAEGGSGIPGGRSLGIGSLKERERKP